MPLRQDQLRRGQPTLAGSLLVASPHANQTPFARTVVLLVQNTGEGSAGIIVDAGFSEVLKDLYHQLHGPEVSHRPRLRIPSNLRLALISWAAGELEDEMRQGVWLTAPVSWDALFVDRELWVELVRRVGRSVLHAARIETAEIDATQN